MKEVSILRYSPLTSNPLITNSLISCYQKVFAGSPWYESWSYEQVREDLSHEITSTASCWIAQKDEVVVGFCWGYRIDAIHLQKKLDIKFECPANIIGYHDELGVDPEYRSRGIAAQLFQKRLSDFRSQGLTYGVVRTREKPEPSPICSWYAKIGYEIIARYPDPDGRIIMGIELNKL